MPAMWGYSSMASIPSYNTPIMRGEIFSSVNKPSYNMPVGEILVPIKPSYNMADMRGRYLWMLTIPPIICLLCGRIRQWQSNPPIICLFWGGDIHLCQQTLLLYAWYVGGIFVPSIPSYNMPIMRGRYLSMPTNPPIICLLCGGIDQWQVFPPIICLLCGGIHQTQVFPPIICLLWGRDIKQC